MTVFLELLGEDLNMAKRKVYRELYEQKQNETDLQAAQRFWSLHVDRNNSIITDLFHGLLKCIITCPICKFKNITYDPFNTLTLTIPSINKIYELNQKLDLYDRVISIKVNTYTAYMRMYFNEVHKKMILEGCAYHFGNNIHDH